jgi:electron transfer flavoprotein beta subunit
MHIVVCIKQIPDPEVPPAKFKIDPATKKVVPPPGVPPVISVFDERACELACRLKEKYNAKITVITMGPGKVSDVVKHALAMGGDDGVILQDQGFEDSDSFGTAYILSQAIKKIGSYDLILCGRQAADWDTGQVGSILAEILGIPAITIAKDIQAEDDKLRVFRVMEDGYEVVETPMPCLVTVSNEVGLPRLPSGMGIIQAARKQIPVWTAQDIQADTTKIGPAGAHTEVINLFIPARETTCEIITADTPAEAAVKLAQKLREIKVI